MAAETDPRTYEIADIAAALIFRGRGDEDPVEVLRQMIAEYDARQSGGAS